MAKIFGVLKFGMLFAPKYQTWETFKTLTTISVFSSGPLTVLLDDLGLHCVVLHQEKRK